jgi:probable F420-dependent oxidoreductase
LIARPSSGCCTPARQAGVLKVFTALYGLSDAAERARALRDAGASGVATFEGQHDVFAPLTLAAAVGGLDLMTNVAIAFPRNPIHLAHQANDHQLLSGGRFFLGLGTQVRPQIEKRFGALFDNPVGRMTEVIAALRAIFEAWNSGGRLDFRGEYYRHTLMTPAFSPGPNPYGPPPIYVGALGPRLTRATAEHADGLLVMPFGSKRFLHETTMPAVHEGLQAGGRQPDQFAVIPEIIVSAGETDADREQADAATRQLLAFYGSTPAYRPVLAAHGWQDLQPSSTQCPSRAAGQRWAG